MDRNPACSVFIGNLDEKVSERVLYEILVQVGRVVDLHIPRDKETNRHKGYAFAEYETEEIANYAVKLFSGLVRLHNRTLRFAISGQDKPSQNGTSPFTPKPNSPHSNSHLMNNHDSSIRELDMSRGPSQSFVNCRASASPNGSVNRSLSNGYSRRVLGSMLNNGSHSGARQPIPYPFH